MGLYLEKKMLPPNYYTFCIYFSCMIISLFGGVIGHILHTSILAPQMDLAGDYTTAAQ